MDAVKTGIKNQKRAQYIQRTAIQNGISLKHILKDFNISRTTFYKALDTIQIYGYQENLKKFKRLERYLIMVDQCRDSVLMKKNGVASSPLTTPSPNDIDLTGFSHLTVCANLI